LQSGAPHIHAHLHYIHHFHPNKAYATVDSLDVHFANFKRVFNKNYLDSAEEALRRSIFAENVRKIVKHNLEKDLGMHSYSMGINKFADLTAQEFGARMNGLKPNGRVPTNVRVPTVGDLPDTVDWRTKGYVTPIKDQAQCGSCWAFSAVASLEGQHFKATNKLVSLSEQNLVDCSGDEGNMGCGGGLMDQAFQYIIDVKGIDTEKSYPYEAVDDTCRFKKANVGATLKSFTDIKSGDEKALQEAVANVGPISVAIDASQSSFQLYSSGVYDEPDCSSTQLDHGVTAVGYGTDNGKDYWLVKNSWGEGWGVKGYIEMSRNADNQCGIATAASYPNV